MVGGSIGIEAKSLKDVTTRMALRTESTCNGIVPTNCACVVSTRTERRMESTQNGTKVASGKSSAVYKDGEKDGEYKRWHTSGKLLEQSFYKDGLCQGEHETCHSGSFNCLFTKENAKLGTKTEF